MLGDAKLSAILAVKDIEEAKNFYGEVLGLQQTKEDQAGVTYRCGDAAVYVYESEYAGTNKATAAGWDVPDLESTVANLKEKGITFDHFDNMAGVTREGDIHSLGSTRAAWFKDPTGNILVVGDGMYS